MDTSSYRKGCFAILVTNLGRGNSWEFWENLWVEINQVQDSKIPIVKHAFTASLLYTQQPLASVWKILSLWNWSLALYVYSHHRNTEGGTSFGRHLYLGLPDSAVSPLPSGYLMQYAKKQHQQHC